MLVDEPPLRTEQSGTEVPRGRNSPGSKHVDGPPGSIAYRAAKIVGQVHHRRLAEFASSATLTRALANSSPVKFTTLSLTTGALPTPMSSSLVG